MRLRRCPSRWSGHTHTRIRWWLCLVRWVMSTAARHLGCGCPDTRQRQWIRRWRACLLCRLWSLTFFIFRFLFDRNRLPLTVRIERYFFNIRTERKKFTMVNVEYPFVFVKQQNNIELLGNILKTGFLPFHLQFSITEEPVPHVSQTQHK